MRRKRKPIVRYFKTFPGEIWGETVRMAGGDWPVFWYNRNGRKLTTEKARRNFYAGKTVVYRIGGSYGGPVAYDPRGMEPKEEPNG